VDFYEDELVVEDKPSVWLVLNDVNRNSLKELIHPIYGYKLSEGDIIRFGKIRFRVKRLSYKNKSNIDFEKEIDQRNTTNNRSK